MFFAGNTNRRVKCHCDVSYCLLVISGFDFSMSTICFEGCFCRCVRGWEVKKAWRENYSGGKDQPDLWTRHSTQSWTAEQQTHKETNMLKCSLTRWHWRHTCLERLSIEADMPENQTKRRQLRDTDVGVWFKRVTETSICHFKSSLSANVDTSDPQSMFTQHARCARAGRRGWRMGGWKQTGALTFLVCCIHRK